MIVVSDTTPIIALLKAGRLDLLHSLFGDVLVPAAVYAELIENRAFKNEIQELEKNSFIICSDVHNVELLAALRRITGLHRGESEAIALAEELDADLLLVDDLLARKTATNMSIRITGTIGILRAGYMRGFLTKDDVVECFGIFREHNLYISDALYDQLLLEIGQAEASR